MLSINHNIMNYPQNPSVNPHLTFCGKNKTCPPTNTNLQNSLGADNIALLNKIRFIAKSQGKEAYLFGGAVRDCLIGNKPHDLDILVNGDALEFAKELHKQDKKTFSGTFLKPSVKRAIVHTKGMNMDIVPLINDGSTAQSKDEIRAALIKKSMSSDFTVNSMIIKLGENENGELKLKLIDTLSAKKDLRENRLKGVNKDEFRENPVLALRGRRYQKRYKMKTEFETSDLIKEHIKNPKCKGNPLRVAKELYKLGIETKNPFTILKYLFSYKLFK